MIIKQICPNCGAEVNTLLTDHNKPGLFNSCMNCIGHKVKSLQELNEERKQQSKKKS